MRWPPPGIIAMHIASIGIDLSKTTFHLVALGQHNKILLHTRASEARAIRSALIDPAVQAL
jgi:hypothetical protein